MAMSVKQRVVRGVGVVVVVGVGTLAAVAGGCVKNAATGKNVFTLGMSRSQQIALGAEAAPQFTQEFGGEVGSEHLQSYVGEIGTKMAAQTEGENPTLPWEFTLLNTPVVNAFALPGGKVFFTRGLAEKLTTEAQMAGVIGHEIGHVTAEHGAQRMASQIAFNVGLAAAAVIVSTSDDKKVKEIGAIGIPALAIGGNLFLLKFGRDEELEADRLGVRYMSKVGYNPRGQREVMEVLASLSKGGSTPDFLSTHPNPLDRVKQVDRLLETDYAFTQNNANFADYSDRYQAQFLGQIKKLPPAPKPKAQEVGWREGESGLLRIEMSAAELAALIKAQTGEDWSPGHGEKAFDANDPTTWCALCIGLDLTSVAPEAAGEQTAGGMLRRAALAGR